MTRLKKYKIYDNTVTIFLLKLSLIMLQNYGGEAPMQLEATCINWSFSLGETRGDIPVYKCKLSLLRLVVVFASGFPSTSILFLSHDDTTPS